MAISKSAFHAGFCLAAVSLTIGALTTSWLTVISKVSIPTAGIYGVVSTTEVYLHKVCSTNFPICRTYDTHGCIEADIGTQCRAIEVSSLAFGSFVILIISGFLSCVALVLDTFHRRFAASRMLLFVSPISLSAFLNFISWSTWLSSYKALLGDCGLVFQTGFQMGHFFALAAVGCTIASAITFALIGHGGCVSAPVDSEDEDIKSVPATCRVSLPPSVELSISISVVDGKSKSADSPKSVASSHRKSVDSWSAGTASEDSLSSIKDIPSAFSGSIEQGGKPSSSCGEKLI